MPLYLEPIYRFLYAPSLLLTMALGCRQTFILRQSNHGEQIVIVIFALQSMLA